MYAEKSEGRTDPGRSLFKSAGIGAVSFLVADQISDRLERSGIPIGSADDGRSEIFNKHPLKYSIISLAIAPIIEEILFRLVPDKLLSSAGKNYGAAVLASSAIFALAHNITEEPNGKLTLSMKKIPLPQLIAGFILAGEMKKGGIINSITAHSAWNITAELSYLGSNALYKYRARDKK